MGASAVCLMKLLNGATWVCAVHLLDRPAQLVSATLVAGG